MIGVHRSLRSSFAALSPVVLAVGLCACPQLLKDGFEPDLAGDPGSDPCAGRLCPGGTAGSGGAGGSDVVENAGNAGSGGTAAPGGTGGVGGVGGTAPGAAGSDPGLGGSTADAPDAGTLVGEETPACWVVTLNDQTHIATNNCLGIEGWNDVVVDTDTTTSVALSYLDGEVCFDGTIQPDGWGAVYSLTFANEAEWNAEALDVGGFQLESQGALLPPQLQVIYTDQSEDYCSIITPGASVAIPFDSAHPDCDTDPKPQTLDPTRLVFLRMVFPVVASAYDVSFCTRVRAIP